jgi:hypothetical protein
LVDKKKLLRRVQRANLTMYGFSGYGTNAYASQRVEFITKIIVVAARTLRSVYGIALNLRLTFSGRPLSDPETGSRTLQA